ncbi:hypothetical protein [Paraburkholderia caballeronis]|uniref:hypothetical protein n=1 Tax=Paraburkholderia caballeronis TaxID=416943 RepID=UPI001066A6B5|nr:hypothetical protein [Paraburkholderia caballeronis]TDV06041.1 hypothetical protein C7408_12422 [Paraburkholderia caballeronis]TDV09581.1 hypothetical protein C7406_12622 [Paraburkholderia caballeronis]TDV21646.1 hypothetical protein C7404_12122 [Paraburkholderia caballeronis]
MARARNIKPGFYTNEDLAECSVWARYIFPGLWMMADREGRLEYRPKKIKGELLRFDEQSAEPLLDELQRWGFIEIYEVDGRSYIQILTFQKHQNPHHREAKSDIPPPKSPGLLPLGTDYKPGATNGLDDTEAQGKTQESPGIEVEDATCQGGQAVLIPDSLIPDSGFSDSPIGANGGGGTSRVRDENAPLAAAEISKSLIGWERQRNKAARGISASNQQVINLADMRVAAAELRVAYDDAVADRLATGDPDPINAGFIRSIVERNRRPQVARASPTNLRDESRRRAYEVLTGKTPASQPEPGVIDGNVKLIG